MGLLQGFGLAAFGFGCVLSVRQDISINNMSDNYASKPNTWCKIPPKTYFANMIIIVVFHRNCGALETFHSSRRSCDTSKPEASADTITTVYIITPTAKQVGMH